MEKFYELLCERILVTAHAQDTAIIAIIIKGLSSLAPPDY